MKRTIWAISIFFTINGFSQNKTPGDTTYIDTIIFENLCNYLSIDTSAQNIWEIGTPSQYFLDSAYTFDKAIMTDTNDFYPINNVSYFDLIFDFGQFPFYYHQYNSWGLSFKHKFDTDTLKDGGFITVSFDNGSSWYNIIEYIDQVYYGDLILCTFPSPNENGLYGFLDTLTQGQYGFSGRSDGWNTAAFLWEVCVVKGEKSVSDTMIVRFNFISDDENTNKEGWLIDDIRLFVRSLGGSVELLKVNDIRLFPNPASNEVAIRSKNVIQFLEVYSSQGKLISRKSIYKKDLILNSTNLKSGLYFLKFYLENNRKKIRKLLITDD